MKLLLNLESDSCAIPFKHVIEALGFMAYGSVVRVMFLMLCLTGCRIEELDNMRMSLLYGNVMYWKPGKNQKKTRKAKLEEWFLAEMGHYRKHNRVYGDRIFGISSGTFRRYFNRDVRPYLSRAWHEKRPADFGEIIEYEHIFQLKGLRKNWATLDFAKKLDKWGNAQVALEFTSKDMRHSSARITAYHYIQNFDALEIEKYKHLTMAEILQKANAQRRLMDFI